MKTVSLVMIVRDEAATIQRCLASVKPWIDHWAITDTGSVDQTREIIKEELASIPGELHEIPWTNFGQARSTSMAFARGKADYHLLLDEQGDQIFSMTDDIAERVRKIGGTTIRSIGHVARLQRLSDNDADYVDAHGMFAELNEDNRTLLASMRETHLLCGEENDVATTSLLENWIDETERRIWFLFETTRTK